MWRSRLALTLILSLCASARADLQEMDADALARTTGQEGIALELRWDFNTKPDAAVKGTPNDACVLNINAVGSTGCRLAMQFANRGTIAGSTADEWTVWKGYYGTIIIPSLYLDAGVTPAGSSGYEDLGRFTNAFGASISPYGRAVLNLTFPQDIEIWNFNITAISVEYGPTGYLNTTATAPAANKGAIGLKMAGSGTNQPATLNVQGAVSIFGF